MDQIPTLLTPGRIADRLAVPIGRVVYILRTRPHIRPAARAGTLRLYRARAVAQVRYELNLIGAKRCARQEVALAE